MIAARCALVGACERAQSSTPFKWNGGKNTSIVGLNSVKLDKYTVIASYTLVADSVYCDYDPIKKKADVGSSSPFANAARSFIAPFGLSRMNWFAR